MSDTLDTLTAEYGAYLTKHGLPQIDAEELHAVLHGHLEFVQEFIKRWEAAEKRDR